MITVYDFKTCVRFFLLSFFFFFNPLIHAQSPLDVNPERYSMPDKNIIGSTYVDEATGRATFTLELAEAKTNNLQQAITLSYSSTGFNVNDKYSTYGKGWSLNYGPVITRDINYFADEQDKLRYHDQSKPNALTSTDMSKFFDEYTMNTDSFDMYTGIRATDFHNNFIVTNKVDLEVDYFYYNINGFKNMFSVLERINTPSLIYTDYTNDEDIHRLYLDHQFVNISRKTSNSGFNVRSSGNKYSFSGGNKIWKRTRNLNFNNGSNTQIDWNHSNIATGFSSYNIESISPDNQYETNDKIDFTYETLPAFNKIIESFHYKSSEREESNIDNFRWDVFRASIGGLFFNEFKNTCMANCMGGLSPNDPSYNFKFNNCISNCDQIATAQSANSIIDWSAGVRQAPEIIKEERKLIRSINSKEYEILFSYISLNNNDNNKVLNEIIIYQKSFQNDKLLLYKYKFSYVNYSGSINLLKDISKYSNDNVLIDQHKFDYYNENLLSSTNTNTFPVNIHNNYIASSINALESSQTGELKEVSLANGGTVKYTYIAEPNAEGVIVSSLDLNSGKGILNYQYTYNNSVPNFYITEQKMRNAIASEHCETMANESNFHRYTSLSTINRFKEVIKPYYPSYFKSVVMTSSDGSKIKKTFDLYGSQVTLIKQELINTEDSTVKKTDYNYQKYSTSNLTGGGGAYIYVGYNIYLNDDIRLYHTIENYVSPNECYEGMTYKSYNGSFIYKNTDLYYLKSVNEKEYINSNTIENNTSYEYDLVNKNNIYPLKIENSDSQGKLYKTTFTYDTKWKPLEESKYIGNILYSKTERKYDNLGQVVSEKIKSYHNNQETLLSDVNYSYNFNGKLTSVEEKVSGLEKSYGYGYGGFRLEYELEFPTGRKNASISNIPNFSSLQLEYDNPQSYFSSLIDVYGLHFKRGYIYNPHGIHKIYDVDKRNTTLLYDAAGRIVRKLDHDGNILESTDYHSKILGNLPLSVNNTTLYGNYNWQAYYNDCLDTTDNSSYNLGCLSTNSTNVYNIKLHFNGNTYNLTSDGNEYILDTALNAGINIPVLNGAGVDGTNLSRLKYGKIEQGDQSFLVDCQIANGYLLLESAYPLCDCEIFFIGVQN